MIMEKFLLVCSIIGGLIFGSWTYWLGRDYSKIEQIAVKHCMKTMNQECGIATCNIDDNGRYKCEVPYTNTINEVKVESNLIIYCTDKICE